MPYRHLRKPHASFPTLTALVLVASACSVGASDDAGSSLSGGAGDDASVAEETGETTAASVDDGASDAATEGSTSPVGEGSSGGDSSGTPDPTDDGGGDSDGTHGVGNCGSGFGPTNDLSHVPRCPGDPLTFHERYQATRANYYHDGTHAFEPLEVAWDDELAALAQQYAEDYAAGGGANGATQSEIGFDSFSDGTYGGYRAIAGAETPTSCDCPPMQAFYAPDAPVFYNNSNPLFRAGIVRMDGVTRMGVGHVAPGDGTHYWTLVFAD